MKRKPIAIAVSIFFLVSNLVFCNEEDIIKIQREAKHDAKKDVDSIEWIVSGCLILVFAIGTSQTYSPDPKPERFIGKSLEYSKYYCQAYEVEVKKLQYKYARIGCCAGMILWPSTLLLALNAIRIGWTQ